MTATQMKLLGFLALWHESANCFGYSANEAFALTVLLFFGTTFVVYTGLEIGGMSAPLTAAFIARGALWLLVYSWLAPRFITDQPISVLLALYVALAYAGAWARDWFFVWLQDIDGQWFRDRSEAVVCAAMGAVFVCFLAKLHWNSVLPLLGYVLLPGLPASCGWLARAPEVQFRFDANFGSEDMFHDVGASDEV